MNHSTVQAKLGWEIRPWAGGCWEVDGCVDVMLSVEVNGWVGVELSVEVELSWDGCARMRGSFSVFTDWTSWIPPSTSSTPLSLTDKREVRNSKISHNYILLLLKRFVFTSWVLLLLLRCIIISCPCIHPYSLFVHFKNELKIVNDFNWTFMYVYLLFIYYSTLNGTEMCYMNKCTLPILKETFLFGHLLF